MADLYWHGDGGNWSDPLHWDIVSGGSGSHAAPTVNDDVFFDANSFTTTGQVVLIDDSVNVAESHSLDFTGVLYNPIIRFHSDTNGVGLDVFEGSVTLSPNMSIDVTGSVEASFSQFTIRASGNITVDLKGLVIPVTVVISNAGYLGIIDLLSDIYTSSLLQLTSGNSCIFNFNNHAITAGALQLSGTNGTYNFGSSVININGYTGATQILNGFLIDDPSLIVNETGSIIRLNYTVNNAAATYSDIELNGQSIGEVQLLGSSSISNPYIILDDTYGSPGSTIRKLTFQPDSVISYNSGGLFIIPTLIANGSSGHPIIFQSDTPGTQYTITATITSISYVNTQDCIAAGNIPFSDSSGISHGNNNNWIFPKGGMGISANNQIEYHLVVKDINGNTIGEFDHFSNLRYKNVLNREGDCSFDIDLKDDKATGAFIGLGVRDVYIYRNDDIVWGGRMWNYNGKVPRGDCNITITLSGFLKMLKKRAVFTKQSYTAIDAGQLCWNLIAASQALTYGNMGITQGSLDLTYTLDEDIEYQTLYDELLKLSGTSPGFDFEITQTKVFNTYIRKGTDKSDTVIFNLDKNIDDLQFSADFENIANQVCVQGPGYGEAMTTSTRSNTDLQASYGLLQKIIPFKNAADQDQLDAYGDQDLILHGLPQRQYNITNTPGIEPDLIDLQPGDWVRVQAEYGNFVSLYDVVRIASVEVTYNGLLEYVKPVFLYQ